MVKRLITALIGLVVFFAVMLSHRYVLYVVATLFTLGMLVEMYRVIGAKKPMQVIGLISGLLICAGFIVNKQQFGMTASLVILILSFVVLYGKEKSQTIMACGFATVAISYMMSMLFVTVKNCNKLMVFLPFICAWMSDSGAYIFGCLLGKHKLCKNLSPKKTVEGSIFGLIFAVIGSVAFDAIVLKIFLNYNFPPLHAVLKFAVIGLIGGITAQLGDLAASAIKRDYDKKDFGGILPGHGGLLDRFDSVLLTIPVVYYVIMYYCF